MIRLINRVQQTATYKSGSPNYIDLTGSATAGMATVASRASSDSWSDGDIVGVLVVKDDSHLEVWTASWNATSSTLEQIEVEDNIGSLSDDDAVTISGTLTRATLEAWRAENQREVLTAARTYYVATTGSDSNDGLTAGTPFLTIQKAVDTVCSLDLSVYQATIQLADGTYTESVVLKSYMGAIAPIIQGNTGTPTNVVVTGASTSTFECSEIAKWALKSMKLTNAQASGRCIMSTSGAVVDIAGLDFGAATLWHISCQRSGIVNVSGAYSISGSTSGHIYLLTSGVYQNYAKNITLTGTPAFSQEFASSLDSSVAYVSAMTFTGSATGRRFYVATNGVIQTAGSGLTFLPGNVAGTGANPADSGYTGGRYA